MKKRLLLVLAVLVLIAGMALAAIPALAQGPGDGAGPQESQPWRPYRPGLSVRLRLLGKAASALDMTRSQILVQLLEGKTVAEVAEDKLDNLTDALLQPRLERLDALLHEGRLTEQQADCLQIFWRAELEKRLSQPLPWQSGLLEPSPSEGATG
jgi:hypothetical protein